MKAFYSIHSSNHGYVFDGIYGLAIKFFWFLYNFFNDEFEIMIVVLHKSGHQRNIML